MTIYSMTSILFDVNMYCRFFSISKLANWVTSDPMVHKGLKNRKFSIATHMLVDIMRLVLLRHTADGFIMFISLCIIFLLV